MQPTSGTIHVDGTDVTRLEEEELFSIRKKCGMVFQHPALFDSLTVFENVAFGLRKHWPEYTESQISDRVRECLNLVHLPSVENKMPQEISYGMQKRVSLARTVAVSPKILLFDEPTTGLDPVTTRAINQLILSSRANSRRLHSSYRTICSAHSTLPTGSSFLMWEKLSRKAPPRSCANRTTPCPRFSEGGARC